MPQNSHTPYVAERLNGLFHTTLQSIGFLAFAFTSCTCTRAGQVMRATWELTRPLKLYPATVPQGIPLLLRPQRKRAIDLCAGTTIHLIHGPNEAGRTTQVQHCLQGRRGIAVSFKSLYSPARVLADAIGVQECMQKCCWFRFGHTRQFSASFGLLCLTDGLSLCTVQCVVR